MRLFLINAKGSHTPSSKARVTADGCEVVISRLATAILKYISAICTPRSTRIREPRHESFPDRKCPVPQCPSDLLTRSHSP